MVRERGFYKLFFRMFFILMLQQVITLSVNLADNIMLGAYAEKALAGVAAVNQIQFIYQQLLLAFGDGCAIVGSQYFGKKDYAPIKRLSAIGMRFSVGLAIGLFALVSLFPHQVMSFFTTDAVIISEGMRYMTVIRFTYFFFAITQMLVATLRATGVVNISLGLSVSTLIINCCINYILIYGRFGAPELGVVGAAIGTLVARIVEFLIMLFYLKFKEKFLQLHLRDYIRRGVDRLLLRDYTRIMLPLLAINGVWGFNNAAQNAILGHMTARALAANSVASTMYLMVKSMAQGAAGAAAFIVGKLIGEGKNEKELHFYAKTMQILFVGIGIVAGLILYNIRTPILSVYKLDPETRAMADAFLVILSVTIATMSYMMPTLGGIIRGGGGAPKFDLMLNMISIWCICIPLAAILAFVVKASPVVVVACLNADQVFKAVPAFIKCNFGHWARRLTRD